MSDNLDEDVAHQAALNEALADSEDNETKENPSKHETTSLISVLQKNATVFMVSFALHCLILFIISLFPSQEKIEKKKVVIVTDYVEVDDIQAPPKVEDIKIEMTDVQVNTEPQPQNENENKEEEEEKIAIDESLSLESEDEEQYESEEPIGSESGSGDDLILAMPSVLGITALNKPASKLPEGYGNRVGRNKKMALKKFKGDQRTIDAVEKALKWLAAHQEKDGSWNVTKYQGAKNSVSLQVSATACAILPFLGAGHSEHIGDYKKNVRNGIRYLNKEILKKVQAKGNIAPRYGNNYGSALALMALSEASLFGTSATTKKNADLVAKMFITDFLNSKKGGWDYKGGGEDFSVSGWVALGLKSAKAAELKAMNSPRTKVVFQKYRHWVDNVMTDKKTGFGRYRPNEKGTTSMTWVGMFQKQFLGFPRNDKFLTKASKNSIDHKWIKKEMQGNSVKNVYNVYYGTLAAFQQQGPFWNEWNKVMKPWMVNIQRKGPSSKLGGSWDPSVDHVGKQGGRVMTTALMALCLEVYYRYGMMN